MRNSIKIFQLSSLDPLWKLLSHVWLFVTPWTLCSLWNSPGQNTGVGSCSLLQGSFQPRDWTQVSCIAARFFTSWATREALIIQKNSSQVNGSFLFVNLENKKLSLFRSGRDVGDVNWHWSFVSLFNQEPSSHSRHSQMMVVMIIVWEQALLRPSRLSVPGINHVSILVISFRTIEHVFVWTILCILHTLEDRKERQMCKRNLLKENRKSLGTLPFWRSALTEHLPRW